MCRSESVRFSYLSRSVIVNKNLYNGGCTGNRTRMFASLSIKRQLYSAEMPESSTQTYV